MVSLPQLKTRWLARHLLYRETMSSTNLVAEDAARQNAPDGLLVITDNQTAGRGRLDHTWFSPVGRNLTFSLLLHPNLPPATIPQLSLVAAISLVEILPALPLCIKWPNDVWTDHGRKIAGILSTMSCTGTTVDYAIVGIGINVNLTQEDFPTELQSSASSLCILMGNHPLDKQQLLCDFLLQFEADYELWLRHATLEPFFDRWKQHDSLFGKDISVEQGNKLLNGVANGITPDGNLLLKKADGSCCQATAGDAHIVGAVGKYNEMAEG